MSHATSDSAAAERAVGPAPVAPAPLFVASIGVRWRDLDAFNHVNNSNYLTYLEEARLQWLRHVPGPWFDEQSMPVLAASEINYRQPIEWPAQLHVELSCLRLGNSSMTIGHRIVDAADPARLYSDGQVVMVWMNPATGRPVALPAAIRSAAAPAG
ncbi:acyl-CoA thioesterase [Frateuria defendens]|uniref:acyl-CoA thioesterase n=1 Tax=Frateuria defendens TaxID=2219559 RepID=UPI00066FF85C|nr:thioesterase family protein [Frateuria defendens]